MDWNKSLEVLQNLQLGEDLKHKQTLTSAVTTGWGVDWDEGYIARDIMQNFFDANRDCLSEVEVKVQGSDVTISAPNSYNLEHLFYFHSTKGNDDIGQYGEGFKAAATCLLRDHHIEPIAISGKQILYIRISDETVGDIRLKPVVYDFFSSSRCHNGTLLILRGCSRKLIEAFKGGMNHFLHDEHPLLGEKLWSSVDGHFALYASRESCGHVFYRRLRRGAIHDISVILVINKEYAAIEKKIKNDRDRNAFGEVLMKTFYNIFARNGVRGCEQGQRAIVEAAQPCWLRGHPLLNEIAEKGGYWHSKTWSDKSTKEVFGDKYFARSSERSPLRQLEYEKIEKQWTAQGRQCLPQYFQRFGVISAEKHCDEMRKKAQEEARHKNQRLPSPAEMKCIHVLREVVRDLDPELMQFLDKKTIRYTVAKSEVLLGQLRKDRGYLSLEVYFSDKLFVDDFARALAVFLHEHSHVFGHDGSREFTDMLTGLLEKAVRHRSELDLHESGWAEASHHVSQERKEIARDGNADSIQDKLEAMGEIEIRTLLGRVPPIILKQLISDHSRLTRRKTA